MDKKEYCGLGVEAISFGTDKIDTVSVIPESGCYLGAVTYYTSDGDGNAMPIGVCWERNPDGTNGYSFDWEEPIGQVVW